MPIDANLSITPTDLIVQQNPTCVLTVTNPGPSATTIPTPIENAAVLGVKVTELTTGVEIPRWREVGLRPPGQRILKAGESVKGFFGLVTLSHIHTPGKFEVSALLKNGPSLIESNAVRVTVSAVTPKSMSSVAVNGGHSTIRYGVCVNRAADPPRLVRHRLDAANDGGATNAWTLAEVPADVIPRISSCANLSVTHAHWIAWLEGETLRAQHIAADGSVMPPQSVKAAGAGSRLVAPLSIDAGGVPAQPARGRALVWTPDSAGGVVRVVSLIPDAKPEPGEFRALDGGEPVWLFSTERSDRSRWLLRAAKIQGAQTLQILPWPEGGKATAAPKRIGTFEGTFLAGDAVLDESDTLHVAMLVLIESENTRRVKLLSWSCPTLDLPAQGEDRDVPWPADQAVAKAIVRIDPRNQPVALIGNGMKWSLFDGQRQFKPGPAPLETATAVDLMFFKAEPAFVIGKAMFGIDILQADGSPLPHKCG